MFRSLKSCRSWLARLGALAVAVVFLLSGVTPAAIAGPIRDPALKAKVDALYRDWARDNYQIADNRVRGQQAAADAAKAGELARQYPTAGEPLVLQAMLLLVEADTKRDMRGLNLAKQAKHILDHAAQVDLQAFGDGSVYTLLGSLYAAVPGFPLGFGDKSKAELMFKDALAVNPRGVDPNYFYGDLLYHEGRYGEAETVLNRALNAPPRPGREVADKGRKREAADLLAVVKKKAARKG